ncbi:MAG: hypothetical protein AB8V10_05105, partial [Francisella endosymbiont of Hyalomma asiaticum]
NVFKLLLLYSTEIEFKRGDKCIDDNLVNIKKLEISFTQLHTRKLGKKLIKQVLQTKNRFNQNVCIIKTQLKRLDT